MCAMKSPKKKLKSLWKNLLVTHFTGALESANIGIIFLLIIGNSFSTLAQFCSLPILIGTSTIHSILSLHRAYQRGKKDKLSMADAAVTVATSLGIIAAIILTFVGQAVLGEISAILLTGTVGVKALYGLGAACYCWYKHLNLKQSNPKKAEKYYQKAKDYTIAFVATALGAAGLGAVLIADQSAFGVLGITASAIGVVYGSYQGYQTYKKHQAQLHVENEINKANKLMSENENLPQELTNNAKLHAVFDYTQPLLVLPHAPKESFDRTLAPFDFARFSEPKPHHHHISCLINRLRR